MLYNSNIEEDSVEGSKGDYSEYQSQSYKEANQVGISPSMLRQASH